MTAENEKIVAVAMARNSLDGLPRFDLPRPFAVRWYRPGDEALWVDIHQASDRYNKITPQTFAEQFGDDRDALSRRQCYLLDGRSAPIGTATAWFPDDDHDSTSGRVHWVAIVPEHQGKGLSKPLMTTVLARMKELGYQRSFLTTESPRIAAIRLYLRFGFVPEIRNQLEGRTWRDLRKRIAPSALDDLGLGPAG